MDLVRYLRVLRRHWRMIAALAAVGAVAGFVLAPRPDTATPLSGPQAYLATHTLFTPSAAAATGSLSLDQVANLVTAGDVPERVAARTGGDPGVLANQVVAVTDRTLGTVEITVQDPDPDRAVVIADTFAEELQGSVRDVQQRAIDQNREVLDARLQGLRIEIFSLPPAAPDDTLAAARRDALVEEIRSTEQQLVELDRQIATGPAFATLRTAEAFPVSQREIDTLYSAGSGSGATSTTVAGSGSVSSRSVQFQAAQGDDGFNPFLAALLGGIGAALLGIVLVLAVNALDPRIFTKEQAEEAFGFPVIAEVPAFSRRQRKQTSVVAKDAPYSRFAESFRALRSSLLFVQRTGRLNQMANLALAAGTATTPTPTTPTPTPPGPPTTEAAADDPTGADGDEPTTEPTPPGVVIMVTSPGPAEGKTTTVSNLAAVLGEDGSRVLVVNCDFRRPRLHLYLHAPDEPRRVIQTEVPGVKMVSGVVHDVHHANPAEVVAAQRHLIATARTMFDYVILDTAPVLTTNDASDVLSVTDMVVVICRAGKTTRETADRAAELLERFNAPVVGAVLVGATESPSNRYYYYYHQEDAASGRAAEPDGNPFEALIEDMRRPDAEEVADRPTATATATATATVGAAGGDVEGRADPSS